MTQPRIACAESSICTAPSSLLRLIPPPTVFAVSIFLCNDYSFTTVDNGVVASCILQNYEAV